MPHSDDSRSKHTGYLGVSRAFVKTTHPQVSLPASATLTLVVRRHLIHQVGKMTTPTLCAHMATYTPEQRPDLLLLRAHTFL